MQSKKVSWQLRFQYRFDNFMSKGGWSVFLALVLGFIVTLILMGLVRYLADMAFPNGYLRIDDDPSKPVKFIDLTWEVLVQLMGLRDSADDANLAARAVGVITIFVGLILFSSLVAFITQEFEARVQELKKGKSLVVESNHSVILGFNDRLVDIIEELVIANESEDDAAVVILSAEDKEEMDEFLRSKLGNLKTTRVVTRNGSITNLKNLHKVRITSARSVIILNDAKGSDPDEFRALADARVIKSILAIMAATGEVEQEAPPIVVELHSEQYRRLAQQIAPGKVTTLNSADILARIMVQTSRSIGLAKVYLNLVGFEGHEFYFYRPESGWQGLTFGDLPFHFVGTIPLGVVNSNGKICLNPATDYKMLASDKAVVLAEDDSAIRFERDSTMKPRVFDRSNIHKTLSIAAERHEIIGWNEKTLTVLTEYAKYLGGQSEVCLVVNQLTDDIQSKTQAIAEEHPHVKVTVKEVNLDAMDLTCLKPYEYDSITILAGEGNDSEEIDARTLTLLLELRQICQNYHERTGEPIKTELIAEIINSEDTNLVIKAGVKDFILSNQFVSKILAQVSQEPEVMLIYEDLFSAEGSELYLKPFSLYLPDEQLESGVTFGDCVAAAQARGELPIGVAIAADAIYPHKNFGIKLAPNLQEQFTLTQQDFLITLAEDQT
ncbi:MAG: CASTOR/POLLUX-related putative ion channel [Prochlorothrix sp.]